MFRPSHYKFKEAFKYDAGKTFTTEEISNRMSPDFILNKGSIRPNAHSNEKNPSSCECSDTDERIFDHIEYGYYKVRPNLTE
jgi:hypothetical protein